MALTAKRRRFVEEYLVDLNATQAAIRAGYAKKRAAEMGYELLQLPEVQAAIQQAMDERSKRTRSDADYVVRRLEEIDQMDLLDIVNDDLTLRPLSQWPKAWRQYLSGFDLAEMFEGKGDSRVAVGILKKIKWPDKVKNLELLGRHHGVFTDKFEHSGPGGGPIPTMPTMIELVAPGESTD